MAKYLLIGSNGTLGSEFAKLIPSEELVLANRPEFDVIDYELANAFISELRPEFIINCAAYTNVDGAETDYETALGLNAYAVKNLSEISNTVSATLIHFSTGMVFSGTRSEGYNEEDPTQPVNKYGESKLEGEKAIQEVAEKFYIIRTEWLYGKPLAETAKKSFIELMIDLGKSGKVKGVIDEIGKPTWAKDLAQSTLELANSGQPKGVYHLTNEGQASRLDWAKEIYRILSMNVLTEEVHGADFPRPAKRPQYELINNTKLPKMRSWQEALTEYLNS